MKKVYLFRVRKEKLDQWKEWSSYLNSHEEEVHMTLKEEEVFFEACDLFSAGEEYFVVGRAAGNFRPTNLDRDINKIHKQRMRECLEPLKHRGNLYSFEI